MGEGRRQTVVNVAVSRERRRENNEYEKKNTLQFAVCEICFCFFATYVYLFESAEENLLETCSLVGIQVIVDIYLLVYSRIQVKRRTERYRGSTTKRFWFRVTERRGRWEKWKFVEYY